MLAPITGVGLALNAFTSFMAVVLGAPGVVTMLVLNLVFGLVSRACWGQAPHGAAA